MAAKKTTPSRSTSSPSRPKSNDPVTDWAKSVVSGKIVQGPHVRNACRRHLLDLAEGSKRGLTWDLVAANRAIGFFPNVLCLNGGQFEGIPFNLHPSQAFRVGSIFGWKRADGTRRFRRVYDEEGKGGGKALALDTPIPTPAGWTTMGALDVGDWVFDETGAPCLVTATTEVMHDRTCHQVKFSDGAAIVADADHLWRTTTLRSGRKRGDALRGVAKADWPQTGRGSTAVRTTADIARTLTAGETKSSHPQAKWNHRVEIAGALDLPPADLPIAPYVLGAWLGDGNSSDARLTVAYSDWGIVREIEREGVSVVERAAHSDTTARVLLGSGGRSQKARDESLHARLRKLGVLCNKHIPSLYLRASKGQRLDLLQGLLDTDGSALKDGKVELTLCSPELVDGALELIRSLGFKAKANESAAVLRGVEVGRRWRIWFNPYNDCSVFRLQRKMDRLKSRPSTRPLSESRRIVGCALVESVPVKCISVNSPSHMYLAGREMVPTHNSPMAAGIGMYCLLADGEARAEVYSAASKKDQAMVLFRDAVAMMQQSPALSDRLTPSGGNPVWNLADTKTGSFFRPISSEDGQSGPRPSCALCDEIHEHRNGTVIEMLERGFKFRRQPLLVMITNSGSDRNSVCWQEHQHAVKVAAGTREPDADFTFVGEVIDDDTFSFVCNLDPNDDPLEDPSCWVKANPLLGVTVKEDYLAGVVRQAKAIPGKLNNILRLHFCIWTDAETVWMARPALEAVLADFDPDEHSGGDVFCGLDLSATQDLSPLAFCAPTGFVDRQDEKGNPVRLPTFDAWVEVWTPGDTLTERALRDQAPYDLWVRDGWLQAPPGKMVRFDYMAARIAEVSGIFDIKALAYDSYGFKKHFEPELDALGLTLPIVEHPQGGKKKGAESGLWMPGSKLTLEGLIFDGRIRIRRSPVTISAIMGAAVEGDAFGNFWFSKRKATIRIDPLVALAMAVGAASAADVSGPSVYEEIAALRRKQALEAVI